MTQKEVADKLYMHLTQYRRYETGESEVPLNIAINIAKLYNVSLDYIAGMSDDKHGNDPQNSTESHMISLFRRLDKLRQGMVIERAEILVHDNKYNRNI